MVGCHAQLNLKPFSTFILFECAYTSYYLFKSSIHVACSGQYFQNLGICSVGVILCHALAPLMYLADVSVGVTSFSCYKLAERKSLRMDRINAIFTFA